MCIEKKCSICGVIKPLAEFEKGHKNRTGGYSSRCKACANKLRKEARSGNRTKYNLKVRIARLKRFCEEHNIEIEIKVKNNESIWR